MGFENVIITGNQAANNNQYSGYGRGGGPIKAKEIQYGRVTAINPDRSIQYELIRNSLKTSKLIFKNAITGIAYNFNPNFTRLPEIGEIVPLIEGPTNQVGNLARQYDKVTYYIIGPISVQNTVDDNKVPQNNPPIPANSLNNYKLNDIGITTPQPGQVIPTAPPPPPPTPTPSNPLIQPSPTPSPSPSPAPNPKGMFQEVYTNAAGQQFDLYSKKSGFNTTIYAYKKGTDMLVRTGPPSSTSSLSLQLNEMKLALQDNIY